MKEKAETSIGGPSWAASVFGVVTESRSYLNLLYLLLAFPTGVAYFVFLVTGVSLGLGLLIVWLGLPVLLLMLLSTYYLTGFERQLAIHLLGTPVAPLREVSPRESPWEWLRGVMSTPATWKGCVFLLMKFPFGIISFVVTLALGALSLCFLFAPLIVLAGSELDFYYWQADTLPEACLCSLLGLLFALVSLHTFNGVAWIWGAMARLMLGMSSQPRAPAAEPAES